VTLRAQGDMPWLFVTALRRYAAGTQAASVTSALKSALQAVEEAKEAAADASYDSWDEGEYRHLPEDEESQEGGGNGEEEAEGEGDVGDFRALSSAASPESTGQEAETGNATTHK